jgi:hypothetical protein
LRDLKGCIPVAFNLDDYEPVAHRLDRWLKDCHVRGVQPRVLTDLVHYLQNSAVFSASLFEGDVLIATGWAEEIRGEGHINKTSHLENCETGAVGRALANAGYAGSDLNKRPSREEMSKVQRVTTQSADGVITERPANAPSDKQVWLYKKLLKEAGKLPPLDLASMDKFQVSKAIEALKNNEPEEIPLPEEEPF